MGKHGETPSAHAWFSSLSVPLQLKAILRQGIQVPFLVGPRLDGRHPRADEIRSSLTAYIAMGKLKPSDLSSPGSILPFLERAGADREQDTDVVVLESPSGRPLEDTD